MHVDHEVKQIREFRSRSVEPGCHVNITVKSSLNPADTGDGCQKEGAHHAR